jgi:hypothetical protein
VAGAARSKISRRSYSALFNLWSFEKTEMSEPLNVSMKQLIAITYSPVPSATSIRLLTLCPCSDPWYLLHIKLEDADLEANPLYDALSYEWGSADELFPILCNENTQIRARTNLIRALLHLGDTEKSRTLWMMPSVLIKRILMRTAIRYP